MKIVHLAGWYFPESVGGTEAYVADLVRRQTLAGHDVRVAAPLAGLAQPRTDQIDGVPVFRYPIAALATRAEAQAVVPARGVDELVSSLAAAKADIVHIHSLATGLRIDDVAAAARTGARIVVTHHLPALGYLCRSGSLMDHARSVCDGVVSTSRCASCVLVHRGAGSTVAQVAGRVPLPIARAAENLPGRIGTALGLRRSIARDIERQRLLFQVADAQVVLNETARRIFAANRLPLERVFVNRLGVASERYRTKPWSLTRSPVRFGCVSRFDPAKGLRGLVRAARSLPANVDFRLEVCGPLVSDDARRFAAELTVVARDDPRITVAAGPALGDVPAKLAAIDVLCCVSNAFENGPTVALEAFAVGTPVLATRVGGQAELVRDGVDGRLVRPGDEVAIATALAEVAKNPGVIDLWRAAIRPVRTMADVAADYEALYVEVRKRSAA